MVNQTNILAILPAPTVGNAPLVEGIANLGDSAFRNYMTDAVRESSSIRENKPFIRNERADRVPSDEPNRSDRPENRPADESARSQTEVAADSSHRERAATSEVTNPDPANADNKTPAPESIDPSKPQEGQVHPDINALLQLLAQQLNLNPDDLIVDTSADPLAQQQKLLSLLQGQGDLTAELLVKAGLTEQEAKNLLAKIQLVQGNQATLQASKETASDVLVKLSGERSVESKADFLSQFSDLKKQGDKAQGQASIEKASIEKALPQPPNGPVQELSQKPVEKAVATAPKLDGLFQSPNDQTNLLQAQNVAANNPIKNTQGVKTPTEVQVQSVNVVSESAARTVEGAKPVFAEALNARGTTEARVINQIINKVSLRSNGSQNEIKIRLDPPSLGTIRMNVATAGDSVRTVVIAENHAVKQIIENNLTQLRDSMQGQGLKVDSFTVLVGGNEGQAGQQNTSHEGRSSFSGFPYVEPNTVPEMPTENLVAGRSRILNYDSQSLSVFA